MVMFGELQHFYQEKVLDQFTSAEKVHLRAVCKAWDGYLACRVVHAVVRLPMTEAALQRFGKFVTEFEISYEPLACLAAALQHLPNARRMILDMERPADLCEQAMAYVDALGQRGIETHLRVNTPGPLTANLPDCHTVELHGYDPQGIIDFAASQVFLGTRSLMVSYGFAKAKRCRKVREALEDRFPEINELRLHLFYSKQKDKVVDVLPQIPSLKTVEVKTTAVGARHLRISRFPYSPDVLSLNLPALKLAQPFPHNLFGVKQLRLDTVDEETALATLFPNAQSLLYSEETSHYKIKQLLLPGALPVQSLALALEENSRVKIFHDQVWLKASTFFFRCQGAREMDVVLAWVARCLPTIHTLILDTPREVDAVAYPKLARARPMPTLKAVRSNGIFPLPFFSLLLDKAPNLALIDAPMARDTFSRLNRGRVVVIPRALAFRYSLSFRLLTA